MGAFEGVFGRSQKSADNDGFNIYVCSSVCVDEYEMMKVLNFIWFDLGFIGCTCILNFYMSTCT